VEIESHSKAHRISSAGAMGPGQLSFGTASSLGVTDPFDPVTSLEGSAHYLGLQLARFHEIDLALAAYNAGPGNVSVNGAVPHNGETEFYVAKVLAEYERRRALPTPK
jgi:soluble lytic murein transglycosylase-like protein